MSINTPNGILDITNAIVRVSKLEFQQATGFDTVLNNVARNTVLLSDTTEYSSATTYHNWALKLPNAWAFTADVYLESGTDGSGDHTFKLNFFNNTNTAITNGYTLGLDGTSLTLSYDGTQIDSATLPSTLNTGAWRKLFVLFERDTFAVAVDGEAVYHYVDTSGPRPRVYGDDPGYVVFYHEAGASAPRKIKNLKFINGDKWFKDPNSSNIAYIGGSVGIGTNAPTATLDVAGNTKSTNVVATSGVYGEIIGSNAISASTVSAVTVNSNVVAGNVVTTSNLEVGTANLFVDTTTGRVGINTTTPGYDLDVKGDINFTGTFYQGGSTFVSSLWTAGSDSLYYRSNVEVGTANLFVDTTTGYVGIGTTSPGAALDVNGTARASQLYHAGVDVPVRWASVNSTAFPQNDGEKYWKIARFTGSGGNYGRLQIIGTLGSDILNRTTSINAFITTRGGLSVHGNLEGYGVGGLGPKNYADIVVYEEGDGTHTAYLKTNNYYKFDILLLGGTVNGFNLITTFPCPEVSGTNVTPTGTLVTDSLIDECNVVFGSNGNVGIGTTDPSSKLHIENGVLVVEDTSETNRNLLLPDGDGTGGALNQHFIGNTHIAVAQFVSEQESNTSTIAIINKDRDSNTTKNASIGFYNTDGVGTSKYAGKIGFWPADANALENEFRVYTTNTVTSGAGYDYPQQRFVINKDGDVGIGTGSPATLCDLSLASGTSYSNTVALTIRNYSSDYTQIANGFGSRIQFKTNRGTSATFNVPSADIKGYIYSGSGGTTDYHALDLDVYGDNASLNKGISILSKSASGGPANTIMHGNVGIRKTDPAYTLDVDGTIYSSGDVIMFSDERKKTNIETIPNALDKVLQLRGVTFGKLDDSGRRHSGVIAQEVEKVLPEVVYTAEDGTKSVAYGNMIGILIEAIKELAQK